jgi:hypothetical protein
MTIADPYPESLVELEVDPITANPDAVTNRLTTAINRLAQAIEQEALARLHPVVVASTPTLAALPPVQGVPVAQSTADVCPIHNTPWKVVPAGVSKKTGNAYQAFRACSTQGCDQRPRI